MGLIRNLTPVCEITGPLAGIIQPRLSTCTVVDAAGFESDSISITLAADDIGVWPESGQIVGCKMGYKEGVIADLGQFKLSRPSQTLYPNTLTLTGTAAKFDGKDPTELKQARRHSWMSTTVGDIVRTLANRHGYSPRVHPEMGSIPSEHLEQTEETDLKFLHRLARKHDAVCKPVGNLLVFAPRGQIKTLTGRVMTPVVIEYPAENSPAHPGFVSATVSGPEKRRFSGVIAQWYDPGSANEIKEEFGGIPRKRLPDRYESKEAAQAAMRAEMRRIAREGDHLQLSCPGNPMLAAECLMSVAGSPIGRMAGNWSVDRVTHVYGGGYRCNVEATRPV